jgi:uncharacterized sulfatase
MQPIDDFLSSVDDSPFFIWYAPFLPHLPHDSPQRFFDRYDSSLPPHQRAYYAACSQFDETVGRLMRMIEGGDFDRPTLYVFVVDNGFRPDPDQPMRDGHGYNYTHRSKRSPFEDGLRTPILFSLDGHSVAATHAAPVSSVDIVPTILQACGFDAPDRMDGINLWPVVTGEQPADASRAVAGAIYPGDASVLGNPAADVAYRWIRRGDFKLILPHSHGGKVWGNYGDSPQLYDLANDPAERRNLAGNPEFAATLERLRRALDAWWLPEHED